MFLANSVKLLSKEPEPHPFYRWARTGPKRCCELSTATQPVNDAWGPSSVPHLPPSSCIPLIIHSFIHLFKGKLHLLCARHRSRPWRYCREQNRHTPCLQSVSIPKAWREGANRKKGKCTLTHLAFGYMQIKELICIKVFICISESVRRGEKRQRMTYAMSRVQPSFPWPQIVFYNLAFS